MAPYTCWCFLVILTCCLCKTEAAEEHYKKVSIPPDYWQLQSSKHCSMPDCSFFCLVDKFCDAFVHHKAENKCELGSIDILDSKFVPKYYPEGKQIFIKGSKIRLRAEKVSRVYAFLPETYFQPSYNAEAVVEGLDNSDKADVPMTYGRPSFVLPLKDFLFLSCGFEDLSTGLIAWDCRTWSFKTRQWNLLKGGPVPREHFRSMPVILNNRLWIFCGGPKGATTTRAVDSLDLISNQWRQEQDAHGAMSKAVGGIVALERTGKILFVGGRDATEHKSYDNHVFLFDASTRTYTRKDDYPWANGHIQCAMDPASQGKTVVCAGGIHPVSSTDHTGIYYDEVTLFDVDLEIFTPLTGDGQKFPRKALINFVSFGTTLYAMTLQNEDTQANVMYRYIPNGGSQLWEELPDARMSANYIPRNLVYQMDYHELLE